MTRRELVRALLGAASFLPAPLLLAAAEPMSDDVAAPPALGPFLDTLLPADGTPSATEVGVGSEILRQMRVDPQMGNAVIMGCLWLDQEAAKRGAAEFAALDAAGREAVIRSAEQAPARTLPRVFFEGVLDIAMQHYYSQPASWPGLGYAGPPQPRGFLDFAKPPTGAKP